MKVEKTETIHFARWPVKSSQLCFASLFRQRLKATLMFGLAATSEHFAP